MGAAPSASTPHAAATAAVCDAIERVVSSHNEYARELHDFAVQRMESDAAVAIGDLKSSANERHKQAARRSSALSTAMKERLLADFLAPTARFHVTLRNEIANPSAGGELASARNRVPLDDSRTGALAPPSPMPGQKNFGAAAAAAAPALALGAPVTPSPAAIFESLSSFEQERAIRAGVEAEVQRVWAELEMQKHYDAMSAKQSFAQKEAALQQALVQTFDELEF